MNDIIIWHRFQPIYLKFNFPNNKVWKLFESKHIVNIQENKSKNVLSRVRISKVIQQTSLGTSVPL